jgi:hypothetical protein
MDLDWQAELVRVSLFSSVSIKISDDDWKDITGQDEAATRTQIPGGHALFGPALDGRLSIVRSGSRVDCILSAPPSDRYLKIGPWPETIDNFRKATVPWIGALKFPITRIAIGSVLLCEAENRDRAYKLLGTLLKSVPVTPKMEDLLFRVNWPCQSASVDGLVINRLTTWAVVKTTISTVTLTTAREAPEAQVDIGGAIDLVRLELDHSTPAEWVQPFDPAKVVRLYDELIALAFENAEKGEVP